MPVPNIILLFFVNNPVESIMIVLFPLVFLSHLQLIYLVHLLYLIVAQLFDMKDTSKIPFSQLYGVHYYAFLIQQVVTLTVAFYTRNLFLTAIFVIFQNVFMAYLPGSDPSRPQYSKQINQNVWVMMPCVVSCCMTPIVLTIFWVNYDYLIEDSWMNYLGGIITVAFTIGGSIDASHQLLHRNQKILNVVSNVNLFFYQFTVYPIEHLYLHHKKVGSPQDPITSPKGQTFTQYFCKAIYSAYSFNYSYNFKIFMICVASVVLYNGFLVVLCLKQGSSLTKPLFFSLCSYASLVLMEAIQYIEHYGLVYREDGESQPSEICSWNTQNKNQLLNLIIFRFQKHTDHHMNAHKVFTTMQVSPKMPKFPFDFGSAMVLAIIPSVWFSVADPLVDSVLQSSSVSKQHLEKVAKTITVLRFIVLFSFLSALLGDIYLKT